MKDMRDRREYRRKFWIENKERLKPKHREYWKKYSKLNREKLREKAKKYYHENIDKMKLYCEKNREKIRANHKVYYMKNKERLNKCNKENNKRLYQKNLLSWAGFIPEKTKCQICNKDIYFNKNNRLNAIHFDHKIDDLSIKATPSCWLGRHEYNLKNKKIWEECNFGMLCKKCNSFLPTKNRKKFIQKVVNYIGRI